NGAKSNPATVFVRINRPVAADDFAQVLGSTTTPINVLANDTDPDGNEHLVPSSVTVTKPPLHGRASVDPSTGLIAYTANPGWFGTDTFQYTVSDDNGATSNAASVTVITVRPGTPGSTVPILPPTVVSTPTPPAITPPSSARVGSPTAAIIVSMGSTLPRSVALSGAGHGLPPGAVDHLF